MDYARTNENLRSIIEGLDLEKDDSVLSIASSGDAGFAMLEFVKKITLVDRFSLQLDYVAKRKQFILNGNFKGFRSIPCEGLCDDEERYSDNYDFRESYFSDDERLSRIREKLDLLEILSPQDIFDVAKTKKGFSKIYFSNCFPVTGIDRNLFTSLMSDIASNVPKDVILYVAEHCILEGDSVLIKRGDPNCLDKLRNLIPSNLSIDVKLTQIARSHEIPLYSPVVYRK